MCFIIPPSLVFPLYFSLLFFPLILLQSPPNLPSHCNWYHHNDIIHWQINKWRRRRQSSENVTDNVTRAFQHCSPRTSLCQCDPCMHSRNDEGCANMWNQSSQDACWILSERTGASEPAGKCVSDLIMWVKVVVSLHTGFVRKHLWLWLVVINLWIGIGWKTLKINKTRDTRVS